MSQKYSIVHFLIKFWIGLSWGVSQKMGEWGSLKFSEADIKQKQTLIVRTQHTGSMVLAFFHILLPLQVFCLNMNGKYNVANEVVYFLFSAFNWDCALLTPFIFCVALCRFFQHRFCIERLWIFWCLLHTN